MALWDYSLPWLQEIRQLVEPCSANSVSRRLDSEEELVEAPSHCKEGDRGEKTKELEEILRPVNLLDKVTRNL